MAGVGNHHHERGPKPGTQALMHFPKRERGSMQILGVGVVCDEVTVVMIVEHAVAGENEVHHILRTGGRNQPGVKRGADLRQCGLFIGEDLDVVAGNAAASRAPQKRGELRGVSVGEP